MQSRYLSFKLYISLSASPRCLHSLHVHMLETSFFKTEAVKNELNFDVDDYVEQQIDKTICIGDEVLWTNYPGQEIQDTNNKEQETDN